MGGVITCLLIICIQTALLYKSRYINYLLYHFQITENYTPQDRYCIASWTNTLEKLNLETDAVFFGNSITRGSSFQDYFPDKKIVNLGYSGDGIQGMIRRVAQVRAVNPKKVFVMAGVNDMKYMNDTRFETKYSQLVDSLLTIVTPNDLYLQSILPVNSAFEIDNQKILERNKIIEKLAKVKGVNYINLHSLYAVNGELPDELTKDGIHLRPAAYERWAEAIKRYIYD